jgi:hypothetical protein
MGLSAQWLYYSSRNARSLAVFLGFTIGTHDLIVTGYGFDACFFHLPLIFIIPRVYERGAT